MVTAAELAEILSVHELTVLRWARDGTIPSERYGRLYRFDLSKVRAARRIYFNWRMVEMAFFYRWYVNGRWGKYKRGKYKWRPDGLPRKLKDRLALAPPNSRP